ncbi:unnamed protein product [Albugo candida]|uniref:Uncharacterized protein n=1 Tax=Albugo candida TaxID=65357 RepID=A0A024G3B0_9STRA|nr:unnamed protein product [Albugo candida]|eukprot:CCI41037.1 unnamed protein product [Albugo candida]
MTRARGSHSNHAHIRSLNLAAQQNAVPDESCSVIREDIVTIEEIGIKPAAATTDPPATTNSNQQCPVIPSTSNGDEGCAGKHCIRTHSFFFLFDCLLYSSLTNPIRRKMKF